MVPMIFAAGLTGCVASPDAGNPFETGTAGPSPASDEGSSGVGSSSGDDGSSGDPSGSDESSGEPLPPFSCDAVAANSPVLDGLVLLDPAQPHPGDTLNVIVRATNGTSRPDAPPMDLEVTTRDGVRTLAPLTVQGGEALYYYAIDQVPEGELCLRSVIEGATEVSAQVVVTPRPPGPPAVGGIFKVRANHQWTCDEQPSFGNELHVWVRDASGQGMPGVSVALDYADSTDPASIYNGDGEPLPTEIVTGADGHGMLFNYWPISDNGLLVFQMQVDGVASDIATELTTGWWEDDTMGCSYCGTSTVNVWGHWSYTVEFQLDPAASEVCVVDNDHAGMSACGNDLHVHHAPGVQPCWSA